MRVFETIAALSPEAFERGTAVAIGKFDGVHLGHRRLLQRVAEVASERHLEPVVFTFANNPLSFLRPELCPPALMSKQQRIEALASEGVTASVILPFDADLAGISAERFVAELLVARLRVKYVCVGVDFRFGHGGQGDVALLAQLGQRHGFEVEVIDDVQDSEFGRVSSSRIREAIAEGDVAAAARMLGRPVAVRGEVVRGDARGRELGFPTANIGDDFEGLRPADGVYAGWAVIRGVRHLAAVSVGANVTFDPKGNPRIEAFVLDFDDDLYTETIEVQFAERLRGMTAFASVEALIARMREDVRETRELLAVR